MQGCERFAFFAMLPVFVLHLHQRHGVTEAAAMLLLGAFHGLSYAGGLPGGILTDRRLGGSLLTLGYAALSLDRGAVLFPALGLMVIQTEPQHPAWGPIPSAQGALREQLSVAPPGDQHRCHGRATLRGVSERRSTLGPAIPGLCAGDFRRHLRTGREHRDRK